MIHFSKSPHDVYCMRRDGARLILWLPDAKSQLLEKILVLGKIGHEFEIVKDREDYCAAGHGVAKSWT